MNPICGSNLHFKSNNKIAIIAVIAVIAVKSEVNECVLTYIWISLSDFRVPNFLRRQGNCWRWFNVRSMQMLLLRQLIMYENNSSPFPFLVSHWKWDSNRECTNFGNSEPDTWWVSNLSLIFNFCFSFNNAIHESHRSDNEPIPQWILTLYYLLLFYRFIHLMYSFVFL